MPSGLPWLWMDLRKKLATNFTNEHEVFKIIRKIRVIGVEKHFYAGAPRSLYRNLPPLERIFGNSII